MERLKERMEIAADAARSAGEMTLRYFQTSFQVETKPDDTPVTQADREAESFLRNHLLEKFPADGFLGEESGSQTGQSGYRWVVDPIDGTKAFVQGVPLYGVLVGLEGPEKRAVVGAVAFPALGDLVCAARGEGCFWNGRKVTVSDVDRLDNACIVHGDEEFEEREHTRGLRRVLHDKARLVRGWGDAYGHVLVATGRAEAMLDPIVEDWDAVAIQPLVEEAGGVFTDWSGASTPFSKSAVSTNAALDKTVRALLAEKGSSGDKS